MPPINVPVTRNVENKVAVLWDSYSWAASGVTAGKEVKMFATPYDNSTTYYAATNQSKSGICPFNFMKILRIGAKCLTRSVTVLPTHDDVHKIIQNCTLTIKKKNITVLELPLIRIPQGVGMTGNVTNSNNSTLGIPENGASLISNLYEVGFNPNTGSYGIDFVKDETLDIIVRAEKAFTPAAATILEISLWCDVDNVLS